MVFDRGLGTVNATIRVHGGWPVPRASSTSGADISITREADDYEASTTCPSSPAYSPSSRGEAAIALRTKTTGYGTSAATEWDRATVTVRGAYESATQQVDVVFSEDRREATVSFASALLVDADNRCVAASTSNGEGNVVNDPDKPGDGTDDVAAGYFAGWSPAEVRSRTDSDGDGVSDLNDKCPSRPFRKLDGSPTADGCRDLTDTDADGKLDDVDGCPAEAGTLRDGCPAPQCFDKIDNDRDGQTDNAEDWGCDDRYDDDERLTPDNVPTLGLGEARRRIDAIMSRRFGNSYEYGYWWGDKAYIGRCRRLGRRSVSCYVAWYIGDASTSGRATVGLRRRGERVLWYDRYRMRVVDDYCLATNGRRCVRIVTG